MVGINATDRVASSPHFAIFKLHLWPKWTLLAETLVSLAEAVK